MYNKDMKALVRMAREKGIPLAGMFELTSRCNLHCGFCYVCDREKCVEDQPEKTAAEWLSMIREAADLGLLKCSFTGGDPFMREDFEEIYCNAYDMGLRISIFTNGILIRKKQRAYLEKRIPDLISVSLYGASEAAYKAVCGGEGNFRRTVESLDGLRAAGLNFELKALAMRPLMNEYEAMGSIAAKYHCPGNFDPYMCPGRDDPGRRFGDWRIPPAKIVESLMAFKKLQPHQPWTPVKEHSSNPGGVFMCGAGKASFIITYDGRMLGCPSLTCFDTYPFRDGFASAWQKLKDLIRNADRCTECLDCEEWGRCFICPADRLCEKEVHRLAGGFLGKHAHADIHCLYRAAKDDVCHRKGKEAQYSRKGFRRNPNGVYYGLRKILKHRADKSRIFLECRIERQIKYNHQAKGSGPYKDAFTIRTQFMQIDIHNAPLTCSNA
jgi:MoaA/NifB/PqqE/SkfB family radical SAM enzyme